MTQDWDRVASWKQYWVDSVGTLYLDDLKSAENLQAGDGRLPLIESVSSSFGFGHFGYGDQGYGGEIWYQV